MLGSGIGGFQSNIRQWALRRGCFLMRPWGLHGGISGSRYHQYLSIFSISISLGADTINIRSEKKATRAPVTQYGMTLGWNSKPPNVYMGGLMMCLLDEGHHDSTQFLPNLNFGGGLNYKTSPQSIILYLSNCWRSDPNYFLTRVSIDNNNRRIEQWAPLNPLIIPSTHDDPIFFCLRTKG